MTSPPMLLGRKLLKNSATRNEPSSVRRGDVHVLRVEQQMPAPHAGEHVDDVDAERDGEPGHRRPARARPQAADVDAREEKREQDDADGELERP